MKTEDFDRLKAVCEKEGFEISTYRESDHNGTLIHIKPKDIWEGVEFAEAHNIIRKIERFEGIWAWFSNGYKFLKSSMKPSNESAYIEQLKAEAFERFGDINECDSFDESSIDGYYFKSRLVVSVRFEYYKCLDILRVGNVTLYRKGKWATKVKERIKVNCSDIIASKINTRTDFTFSITSRCIDENNFKSFLAIKLEEYLNKE